MPRGSRTYTLNRSKMADAMLRHRITDQDIAVRCQIAIVDVRRWTRGKTVPKDHQKRLELCRLLQLPPRTLFRARLGGFSDRLRNR